MLFLSNRTRSFSRSRCHRTCRGRRQPLGLLEDRVRTPTSPSACDSLRMCATWAPSAPAESEAGLLRKPCGADVSKLPFRRGPCSRPVAPAPAPATSAVASGIARTAGSSAPARRRDSGIAPRSDFWPGRASGGRGRLPGDKTEFGLAGPLATCGAPLESQAVAAPGA
jgi:hypothetical protein